MKSQSAADCEVETPVGVLRASRPDGKTEIGQSVQCSIRPESWRVDDGTENRLEAKLESVMYLGAHEQYRVLLTGGRETSETENWREIKIAIANPQSAPPQTGSTLTLSCAPEDVVVLDA